MISRTNTCTGRRDYNAETMVPTFSYRVDWLITLMANHSYLFENTRSKSLGNENNTGWGRKARGRLFEHISFRTFGISCLARSLQSRAFGISRLILSLQCRFLGLCRTLKTPRARIFLLHSRYMSYSHYVAVSDFLIARSVHVAGSVSLVALGIS
jgi:hypothetical protein